MLNRGFTLLEVLVTLVILLFGLLGVAGLMAKGQRLSFEAFQRQQALALANDMAERLRANNSANSDITYFAEAPLNTPLGPGNYYAQLLNGQITDCGTGAPCSTTQIAQYDIALWDGLLNGYTQSQVVGGARTGGIINARGCIANTGSTQATSCPGINGNATYTQSIEVSVAWQGHDQTVAPLAQFTCGTGLYGLETQRRVVALDLMLVQPC
jgi:type IV pilus assembly protein PilV